MFDPTILAPSGRKFAKTCTIYLLQCHCLPKQKLLTNKSSTMPAKSTTKKLTATATKKTAGDSTKLATNPKRAKKDKGPRQALSTQGFKNIIKRVSKRRISSGVFPILRKDIDLFVDDVARNVSAYAKHGKRKTITDKDILQAGKDMDVPMKSDAPAKNKPFKNLAFQKAPFVRMLKDRLGGDHRVSADAVYYMMRTAEDLIANSIQTADNVVERNNRKTLFPEDLELVRQIKVVSH